MANSNPSSGSQNKVETKPAAAPTGPFQLPALPYPEDALAPHISAETIQYHYGKHHKAYIDKTNTLVVGSGFEGQSLEAIVCEAKGELFNNAAQAWNHTFFWNCLTPNSKAPTNGEFFTAIEASFGSFAEFKTQFSQTAEKLFGSGWVWLARDESGKLLIQPEADAGNPLVKGAAPLLALDVWEHAYYIDYRNVRKSFIENFWDIVNWEFVQDRFASGARYEQ